jgi:hypothetical protein
MPLSVPGRWIKRLLVTYYGTVRSAGEHYGKKYVLFRFTKRPQDFVAPPPSFIAKFDNSDAILKVDFSLVKNLVIVSLIRNFLHES